MGTVGINFGSASGGTGFDVAATVASVLGLSSAVETPWKNQITRLQAQDAAFTSLGTDLSALSTALSSLTNFDGVLSNKQGSSSNSNVLTLGSAGSTAVAGSHTVVVTSLATTSSNYTDQLTNAADTLSGTVSLKVGSGSTQTITIDSTNNTLAGLAAAINNGAYGVIANVVTDTHGSRLSIVSKASGAAGQITTGGSLTDATANKAVNFSSGQSGADAVLTVDGLLTSSASNTVTGAIPGVTFQLLSSSPNTSVQVQIANDNSAVETTVQAFVTAYNKVLSDVKTQEGKTAGGAAEPLFGNPTLALVQGQLSTNLLAGGSSGSLTNIQQLGLSANADGTLKLDVPAFDGALNAHFSDVVGFFQNAGSFGQQFASSLSSLGSSTSKGAVSLALAQNSTVEAGLTANIAAEEALLATQKIFLTKELNLANQELQSIPQQLAEVDQIYSAITGYNQK